MRIIQAPRASAILYNLLKSQENTRTWLLPANICPIVPITFCKAGIAIEFIDISPETLHIDLELATGRLAAEAYGGLLYAHTYGEPSTPNIAFREIKSNFPELLIIDDRCLCSPELEASPDAVADVTLHSTGYAKMVDLNFGGYAFVEESVSYRPQHLPFSPQAHEDIERQYKNSLRNLTPYVYLDSAWLQTHANLLSWSDYRQQIEDGSHISMQHRTNLNKIYTDRLPLEIQLPPKFQAWRFNLRLGNRDSVLDAIFSAGLFASSHYASMGGIMGSGRFPNAEALAAEIINLFNDHHFDTQKADQICSIILNNLS